ncbi:hypothetical protein V5O48_015623 [Marasmius crinis-equi]|uniref:F-box domain-containing protein n=1 Tax=Marasmius crinis-equi TaxID=585013 RepID=A0ABR3EU10_9AGAR
MALQHVQTGEDGGANRPIRLPCSRELFEALRNNRLPAREQKAETLAHIRNEEALVRILDIVASTKSLREDQQALLEQQISCRRSWLAPIRQLPVEILDEIFQYVCLDDTQAALWIRDVDEEERIHCPTLTLGWICHYWRSVVHSSPRLWASFSLDDVSRITANVRSAVEFYLARSNRVPLRKLRLVDSKAYGLSGDSDPEEVLEYLGQDGLDVLKLLMQEMGRSCILAIDVHPVVLNTIAASSSLSFPYLSGLSDMTYGYPLTSPWLWKAVREAPRLNSIHFASLTDTYMDLDLLPLETLNSLVLEEVSGEMLLKVLSAFKRLKTLLAPWVIDRVPNAPLRSPVVVPYLRYLYITTALPLDSISPLFGTVTIQSLEALELKSVYEPRGRSGALQGGDQPTCTDAWVESLGAMLDRSGRNLVTLKLSVSDSRSITVSTLPLVLRQCPKLRILEFRLLGKDLYNQIAPTYTIELLSRINIPAVTSSTYRPLVPRLTSLSIQEPLYCLLTGANAVRTICNMVKSRSRSVLAGLGLSDTINSLELVNIEFPDNCADKVKYRWPGLERLKGMLGSMDAEGMECVVQRLGDDSAKRLPARRSSQVDSQY